MRTDADLDQQTYHNGVSFRSTADSSAFIVSESVIAWLFLSWFRTDCTCCPNPLTSFSSAFLSIFVFPFYEIYKPEIYYWMLPSQWDNIKLSNFQGTPNFLIPSLACFYCQSLDLQPSQRFKEWSNSLPKESFLKLPRLKPRFFKNYGKKLMV